MEEQPHRVNVEDGQQVAKENLVQRETSKSSSSSSERKRSSQSKSPPNSPDKDAVPEDDSKPGPSSRSSSPEPNCAICLEPLQNKSFTDSCFHTFCFTCLVEWSKVKPECPLCKQKFKSIVHNVQKDLTFDEYHIASRTSNFKDFSEYRRNNTTDTLWTSILTIPREQRFRYATTQARTRFLERGLGSYQESYRSQIASHRMRYAPHSVRYYTTNSQVISRQPCPYRRRIYEQGLWVKPVTGRTRIVSPEFYRQNPACTHRLLPWLNRELSTLLYNHDSQVTFLIELIMALVARYGINSQEFLVHIEPYMGTRTSHFIHELYNFAISPYDMENYDRHADYGTPPSSTDQPLSVSSSPDSDIIPIYPSTSGTSASTSGALDMTTRNSRAEQANQRLKKLVLKKKGENTWESIITPGPLVHNYTTMHCYFSNPGPSTSSNSYLITEPISSASPSPERGGFSDDECQVVQVVKPRSERTPEIVDLSSDDDQMIVETVIDISSDNDYAAYRTDEDQLTPFDYSSRVSVPTEDDSEVECVFQTEPVASTSRDTEMSHSSESSSRDIPSTSGNEPSTSTANRGGRRITISSSIVRPWDIPSTGKPSASSKSKKYIFRANENEPSSSDTGAGLEVNSTSSKKFKLTSVVASFSINCIDKPRSKKESGHRSSHKKHKDKKKKKKKKHVHKHRRHLSSDTESG